MEEEDNIAIPIRSKNKPSSNNIPIRVNKPVKNKTALQKTFENTGGIARGFNTGYGQSKYDQNLNWDAEIGDNIQQDINEHRAQNQSWGAKASAGIARAGVKAATEIAKLVPTVGGIIASPFADEGQGWETAFNNEGHKALNSLNESINEELLPVYVKKSVKEGGLLANLSSIDFWATEGADGVGFMAAMFAPGVALKALGGANKFRSILGGFEKGRELLSGAANLGLKADEVGITLANTIAEAGSESGSQMEAMNKSKPEYLKLYIAQGNTPEQAEQMFNEQKARVGRDAFVLNMALLSGTNFVNTKMLNLAGDNAVKKVGNFALRDTEGNMVDQIAKRTLKDRFFDIPKKAGTMLFNEGFVEEGTQSTIENYLKHKSQKGDLTDSIYDDIHISELGSEYADMLTTTEGQKAIALGGILGYGSVALSSAKNLLKGKGTEEDHEIERINTLLTKGKEATNLFFAKVDPDIYKRTEEINPETGENEFEIVNGKKVVDDVKRDNFILNAKITEADSKEWDEAFKNNDTNKLQHLQNIAEARLVASFIADSADGLNILSEYLKDNQNIPEDRKKSILQKATVTQKSHEEFLRYSQPVLNLKNKDSKQEDVQQFHDELAAVNMMNTLEKVSSEQLLAETVKTTDDLLSQHGLDRSSLQNEALRNQLSQRDMRFKDVLLKEDFYNSKLNAIKQSNLDIWNPKHQQEAFDQLVAENKETRNRNSTENQTTVDSIASNLEAAITIEDVNKALNGDNVEILDNKDNPTEITSSETKPIDNVDSKTAKVLQQQANDKKKEIVTKTDEEITKGNENVKENIVKKIETPENVEIFEDGSVLDLHNGDMYDSIEQYNAAHGVEIIEELPVDTSIHELDQEDVTDIVNESIPEDIPVKDIKDSINKISTTEGRESFPDASTVGINRDKNSKYFGQPLPYPQLQPFINFINNFKSVVNTPVTFTIPETKFLNDDNKKALDLLNSKKIKFEESDLDKLYRHLPLQVNIDSNIFTYIASLHPDTKSNMDTYTARKNIVDSIILNHGNNAEEKYEGITSKISYQKGGTLTYDKTGQTENKISSLKEFETTSPSLFFVKDIDGNIYNEQGQQAELLKEFPFNLKNPHTQKGYVYTIIHSPGGIATPVKLNVRKLNIDQAKLIYKVYKTLFDYNQDPNNVKLSQANAKLTDLYKIDHTIKTEIETKFAKELNLFKNKNTITVGDFMTLFIHDNVNYDGTTKPYTTKYQNGQLIVGQEGLLSFTGDSQLSEDEFINFLTTQKRQNTKLSYLAGENSNVNKNKYKDYLLNEVTSVNIDTQQPFKGDINVYIDTNIKVPEKPKVQSIQSDIEVKEADIEKRRRNELIETFVKKTDLSENISINKADGFIELHKDNINNVFILRNKETGEFKSNNYINDNLQDSKYDWERIGIVDANIYEDFGKGDFTEFKEIYEKEYNKNKNIIISNRGKIQDIKIKEEVIIKELSEKQLFAANSNAIYFDLSKKINAKYDAELVALKSNENKLEKNTKNTLNSETNNVSSLDNSFKTEAITEKGLSQLKGLKKKNKVVENLIDNDLLQYAKTIVEEQSASASLLQRKFKIGYNVAGDVITQLEELKIVGPFEGAKARKVFISDLTTLNKLLSNKPDTNLNNAPKQC